MKKHGYAIYNNGTAWAGIPACLKHFGMKDVKSHQTMSEAFKRMSKGYLAVVLFSGGTRGGVTWTLGGHYLGATGYKVANGKHYLYMRDPGGRRNDGWFAYETTMRGLVSAIWTCTYDKKIPVKKKKSSVKKAYAGAYPTANISINSGTTNNIKKWQKFLSWWSADSDFAIDGIFGPETKAKTIKF